MRKLVAALLFALSLAPAFAQAPPPVPALPDTERRTPYALTASTCICSVGFALYGDSTDYGNWIEVYLTTGTGVLAVTNKLTAVTDYTITSATGPLATIPRPITNAVLTLTVARTGTLQIVGSRRPRRVSQFPENRGVLARDLNQALTDIIASNRETWDRTNDVTGRAFLAPPGETVAPLPPASVRAGNLFGFDAFGNATLYLTQQPSAVVSANQFLGGPTSGLPAGSVFRALVGPDLPAPFTSGGRQGNTSAFQTYAGSAPTPGHIPTFDANGNLQDGGASIVAALVSPARQAIIQSSVDSSGFANFAAAGSGLAVSLSATATPIIMDFAAGNGGSGTIDFIGQIASDQANYWPSLPASNLSFLSIDRNASTTALTATQTLVRPQYGPVFYAPRQLLMHFENNLVDDWGNSGFVSNGASFSASAKFGSFAVRLSGSSSYVQTTSILNPGQGNWKMDVWGALDSNNAANIFSIGNFGMWLATNASGKLSLSLSSNCSTFDIANATLGASTVTAATYQHFKVTFDGSTYRVFYNGNLELSVTSSTIVCPDGGGAALGARLTVNSTTGAYFDEWSFGPYADNVASFTPPVAAYSVSGDWFDTTKMVMKTASGAGPTWTAVQRIYVAETQTNGSNPTSVWNYQTPVQYSGADFAFSTVSNKLKSGNSVFYAATPQFITSGGSIGTVTTYRLSSDLVPPDAKWFWVQATVFHSGFKNSTGVSNQDCTFSTRLPTGVIQNYGPLGTAYSNYSNTNGAAGASLPFTQGTAKSEYAGIVLRFPVINGVAAFEGELSGSTCTMSSGTADDTFVYAVLLGYDMR